MTHSGTYRWLWIVSTVVMLSLTSGAEAGKTAREFFEPVMTHRQFAAYVRQFDLDRQQRMIAELVFEDYTDAISSLVEAADREADAVGRQTVIEAFSGRRLVDPEQLRSLRLDVLEVYRTYLPRVDEQFEMLIQGVHSLLLDDQLSNAEAPLRQLRRSMLLHPRQSGRRSYDYAGDGLDMLLLIDEQRREGGALHGLREQSLQSIKETYERHLDELLVQTSSAYRTNRMDARMARIRRDREAQAQTEREGLELWRQFYTLNERAARQVGDVVAAELGQGAREQWQSAFLEACFPWMFTAGAVDRAYEWMTRQNLTEEQIAEAEEVYEAFKQRRWELREAAIRLMMTARMEMHSIVYAMMARTEITNQMVRGIHEQLLRNSGELASAESDAIAGFESLLDDNLRMALRRALRR